MDTLTINIPAVLGQYVESALARLGYLYSDVEWTFDAAGSQLSARYRAQTHQPEALRKEALFQLYREKIHHDTRGIRARIYEAL
jgi:hypothetical protein